jgi:hypothetical protein
MIEEEKICPYVGEPCIGTRCSEFVPTRSYVGHYNIGIQDVVKMIWCMVVNKEYIEPTYTSTVCAHCRLDIRSARRRGRFE